jgi:hypothetical protein
MDENLGFPLPSRLAAAALLLLLITPFILLQTPTGILPNIN